MSVSWDREHCWLQLLLMNWKHVLQSWAHCGISRCCGHVVIKTASAELYMHWVLLVERWALARHHCRPFCSAPNLALFQNCCNCFVHLRLFPDCLFSASYEFVHILRSRHMTDSITVELDTWSQTHRCWLTGQQQPGMIDMTMHWKNCILKDRVKALTEHLAL